MQQANSPDQSAEMSSSRYGRRNLIFAILSLCLCLSIPVTAIVGSQGSFGRVSDFPEYYAAARMLVSGAGDQIYKLDDLFGMQHHFFPDMGARGIGFYIPPFSAILLLPLACFPAFASYGFYMLFSCLALIAGAIVLGKHFRLEKTGIIWLITAIFVTAPAFESLKIAQLAPYLFAALSFFLFWSGRKKDIAAGASLALLLLKPQELLPLVVYLAFARRFKILFVLFAFFIVLVLISLCLFGVTGYCQYFALLKDSAANTQFMQPELSATLRGQLLRFNFPGSSPANLLSSSFLAATLSLTAFVGWRCGSKSYWQEGLLRLALPLGFVSALHCHDYDLLLLAPFALSLFLSEDGGRLISISRALVLLLLFLLLLPVYVPIHYEWLLREHQIVNPIFVLFFLSSLFSAGQILSGAAPDRTGAPGQAD